MGYIRHDAIIATSFEEDHIKTARLKARKTGLTCSEIVYSPMNGYASFMIVPDGSKEGWEDSQNGDKMRKVWIRWIQKSELCIDWAHISFGGDAPETTIIVDHN